VTRPIRVAAIVAAIGALYLLRLDRAAGLYVDDAWHIVLAKALWQGDGFRLISSATTPILPAFPPGFALILAPVIGLAPDFPGNVFALKAVSIAAMFGVGIAAYLYVARYRASSPAVAAVVALITVILPAFVFLATSTVMAEASFTLSQLLLALGVERAARAERTGSTRLAVAGSGVIGAASLLLRLAGVAGVAAATIYHGWRRGARSAAGFAVVVALCYAPWALYSFSNAAPASERAAHGGSVSYGYEELLLMRRGGEPSSGRATLADLPGRVAFNAFSIFGHDTAAFIFPAAFRGPSESGVEVFALSAETGFRATSMGGNTAVVWVATAISVVMVAGFVVSLRRGATVAEGIVALTIAMVLLVPAQTFRYVLPLAPFLIFYFFCGVDALTRGGQRFASSFRITAACVIALLAIEHAQYITLMRSGATPWLQSYEEVKSVTDWMRANLSREGPVAASNPGLVYLTTGRKTLALTNLPSSWQSLQKAGVPYGAALTVAEPPAASLGLPMLYQSPRLKLWVVELPVQPGALTDSGTRP
jgi:hypothetical protein